MTGVEALTALYDITGMGWLFKLAKLPVLSSAAEIAYKVVSKNRQAMGGAADACSRWDASTWRRRARVRAPTSRRCREKPPPVDEEAEEAARAAEERRAKIAAEKEAEAAKTGGGPMNKNPAATSKGGLELPLGRRPQPPAAPSRTAATSSACTT